MLLKGNNEPISQTNFNNCNTIADISEFLPQNTPLDVLMLNFLFSPTLSIFIPSRTHKCKSTMFQITLNLSLL